MAGGFMGKLEADGPRSARQATRTGGTASSGRSRTCCG